MQLYDFYESHNKMFPSATLGTDFIKEIKSLYYAVRNKSLTHSR